MQHFGYLTKLQNMLQIFNFLSSSFRKTIYYENSNDSEKGWFSFTAFKSQKLSDPVKLFFNLRIYSLQLTGFVENRLAF